MIRHYGGRPYIVLPGANVIEIHHASACVKAFINLRYDPFINPFHFDNVAFFVI
jgi:hypothetical protein